MELRPYQKAAKDAIFGEWDKGMKRTLLVLPTGCHARGEKVLLSNGTDKEVEKVNVGDRLMGSDGTERTVLSLTRGTGKLYKITPVKGTPFVVNEDHLLTLVRTTEKKIPRYDCQKKSNEIIDVSVKDWLTWSKNKKHLYKLIRSDCISNFCGDNNDITMDPYFLGILLGDGGITTTINVTTPDHEIVEELYQQAAKYSMYLESVSAGKARTYFFKGGVNDLGRGGSKLHKELKELGLRRLGSGNKHVPFTYKTSDYNTRIEVIAGLLDSDGSARMGGYDFISKSKQLSEDMVFMCKSIGLAAYLTECKKGCQNDFVGTYYRVSISGDCCKIPCRVKRKQQSKRKQKKDVLRTGFDVEYVGNDEYFGFTVDKDNRYLLNDFTITHNCGKTIVFAKVAEECVRRKHRVLIMAHRGELLEQASDKIHKATGLGCSVEKAEQTCLGEWFRIVVGSVQSLQRENRLKKFTRDYFDTIIIDEAHHCLSSGYQRVLEYFDSANVLGVTATPDRGDMRNLGSYFESLAYEYTLPKAIKEEYLTPIKALTVPLQMDLSSVGVQAGDFKVSDIGTALDPYLYQIADEMLKYCKDRKTVVFLPLIATSQKFKDILNEKGFRAAEVNGTSQDRADVLTQFDQGIYNVLCNSMLLTEGWDCPSVDCIIVLRPTKVRSLYCQMVGRGTRLCDGKEDLLLLDFLWHTDRHELCHPASLICEKEEVAEQMTKNMEATPGIPIDIEEAEEQAASDVVSQREESLAKELAAMKTRKRKLVDPLQFEMSIQAEDLTSYVPAFGWEMAPPSEKQVKTLEKLGIFPDEIDNAGKASLLLERLDKRRSEGLTTPKQIRFLESRGFQHVGTWNFQTAKRLIDRIAANGWKVPHDIVPGEFKGE